ncbi:MAG: peptide chain release factor 1 [Ignavibacteriales bacterium]|nr:peptide chain release factor 1 [Ignavibacteriales bacterium]
MIDKLANLKKRYDELTKRMSDPEVANDHTKVIELSKERAGLEDVVKAYDEYAKTLEEIDGNKELMREGGELGEMAREELDGLEERKTKLEEEIKVLLLPKDPNDDKNVVMEIRAGAGGEEAALFAGDLFRMYTRYAELKGWKLDMIELNDTGIGGVKEAVFSLEGKGAYGNLKFESGVHRVQRVPETETSGRVHTSAASVAALPEAEDVQIDVDPNDLKIDVYRSGGAGGQNVNKVETAIRITHLPTGVVVQCQDERSQLKNRQKAMKALKARLYDMKLREQNSKIAAQRKSMVGSGDRSDKIRTYNFPQNRVTDHRINVTIHRLQETLDGDLDALIEQCKLADRAAKLEAATEEASAKD